MTVIFLVRDSDFRICDCHLLYFDCELTHFDRDVLTYDSHSNFRDCVDARMRGCARIAIRDS